MVGAYLVTFPDPFAVGIEGFAPAGLALAAALLWGLGTVLGRHLTAKVEFAPLTALRFAVGFPASAVILFAVGEQGSLASIGARDSVSLLLLALIPGLAALLIYCGGLRETPAASATLAELTFPLSALTINYLAFDAVLGESQWLGLAVLVVTITAMVRPSKRGGEELGVTRSTRSSRAEAPARS